MDGLKEATYGAIIADPPWSFKTYNDKHGTTPHRGANDHYKTMTKEDIQNLNVSAYAAKDCALFLWVVDSHLNEAIELGTHWGFEYKTIAFVWVKTGKNDPAVRPIGMGYWTRKQTELCLLFTKGKPKRQGAGVRQLFEDPDIYEPRREHSRKPDSQYERVERLVDGPYLEMFARQSHKGWDSWGNQAQKFDDPVKNTSQVDLVDYLDKNMDLI